MMTTRIEPEEKLDPDREAAAEQRVAQMNLKQTPDGERLQFREVGAEQVPQTANERLENAKPPRKPRSDKGKPKPKPVAPAPVAAGVLTAEQVDALQDITNRLMSAKLVLAGDQRSVDDLQAEYEQHLDSLKAK